MKYVFESMLVYDRVVNSSIISIGQDIDYNF